QRVELLRARILARNILAQLLGDHVNNRAGPAKRRDTRAKQLDEPVLVALLQQPDGFAPMEPRDKEVARNFRTILTQLHGLFAGFATVRDDRAIKTILLNRERQVFCVRLVNRAVLQVRMRQQMLKGNERDLGGGSCFGSTFGILLGLHAMYALYGVVLHV